MVGEHVARVVGMRVRVGEDGGWGGGGSKDEKRSSWSSVIRM